MDLNKARRMFEASFGNARMGLQQALTENGTPYIAFCSGGVKPEGSPIPVLASTIDRAVEQWYWSCAQFLIQNYAHPEDHILIWRVRPQMNTILGGDENTEYYSVYSRFAIEPIQL